MTIARHLQQGRGAFSPSSVSGLRIWYKADALTGLADGDKVVTWPDSSGNGVTGTTANVAASLNRPLYKTNIVNGLPVVRFLGLNASDISYVGLTAPTLTAVEVFVVVKLSADPPGVTGNTGFWNLGSQDFSSNVPYVDGVIYDGFGSSARKTTVNPTPSLASTFRLYNVTSVSGEWTSRLDTTQLFTTATNTVSFSGAGALGVSKDTGSFALLGDIPEFAVYDNKVSTTSRASLAAYFKAKYALSGY